MGRTGWGIALVWMVVLGSFDSNSATWKRYAFEIPMISMPDFESPSFRFPRFDPMAWGAKFLKVDG